MLTIIIKDVASIDEAIQQLTQERRVVVTAEDLEGQPGPVAEPQPVEVEEVKPVQTARRKWAYNKVKWTKEMEDFIMKRSHLTDSAITEELFRHFRVNCSTSAVNHRLQRIRANKPREIYIDGVFIKHWTD